MPTITQTHYAKGHPDFTEEGFRVRLCHARETVADLAARCMAWCIGCDRCGHGACLTVADYSGRFPAEATVEAIGRRLVCETCGHPEGAIDFSNDHGAAQSRDIERMRAEGKFGAIVRP